VPDPMYTQTSELELSALRTRITDFADFLKRRTDEGSKVMAPEQAAEYLEAILDNDPLPIERQHQIKGRTLEVFLPRNLLERSETYLGTTSS
jgi:hypothetical protein